MPKTYGKTRWRGLWACGCMIESIEDVIEPRLRKAGLLSDAGRIEPGGEIRVFQGAYSNGSLSGNTHAGGGAIDISRPNTEGLKIWRSSGVAMWPRGRDKFGDSFDPHGHGIWIGCPHLSNSAEGQVTQYKNHQNGLVSHGPDRGPRVPYITWEQAYDKYVGQTPPVGKGLFGMSKSVYQRRSEDTPVAARDVWKDLMVNDDDGYTVVSGKTSQVTVSAIVHVGGLKAGETFDLVWRIAKFKEGKPTTYPHSRISERVVGPGTTVSTTFNGGIPDVGSGYSPRLRLSYKTSSKTAVVSAVMCQGWST